MESKAICRLLDTHLTSFPLEKPLELYEKYLEGKGTVLRGQRQWELDIKSYKEEIQKALEETSLGKLK